MARLNIGRKGIHTILDQALKKILTITSVMDIFKHKQTTQFDGRVLVY